MRTFDDKVNDLTLELSELRRSSPTKRKLLGFRRRLNTLMEGDTTAFGTPRLTLALREVDGMIEAL